MQIIFEQPGFKNPTFMGVSFAQYELCDKKIRF